MLPFGSVEFFALMAIFVAIIGIGKVLNIGSLTYKYVLVALNAVFLIIVYPSPVHFFLLIVFSYLITYVVSKVIRPKKKIWGLLLLLLPMLLVKFNIRVPFYPFELNNLLAFAGLSYASFRIMGYYMDRSPNEPMADPATYFNFLAFTPTLLIGPIDKYARFRQSQDTALSNLNTENYIIGWNYIVKGVAFKYVLAELVDRYWLNTFPTDTGGLLPVLNGMYAYYAFLFFDFAGYSHMALGIGKMMGINVPVNFTNPFVAVNPQDFWRRFHISLGEWLKEYFFTPLYLYFSRLKRFKPYPAFRQNFALLMTFLLMGCWNGFKAHYVISGLLFGLYSAIHNQYVIQCKKTGKDVVFGNLNPVVVKYLSIFIMINLVAFSLYIFSGRLHF